MKFEEWVVLVEDHIAKNVSFPGVPTESLQASTDSEEKPSIFCSGEPLLVYFSEPYHFRMKSQNFSGWHFVAFMSRWFDLDVGQFGEYVQEKKNLVRSYYLNKDDCYGDTVYDKERIIEYLLIQSCILVFAILFLQNNVQNVIEILREPKEKKWDPNGQMSIEFYNIYQCIMINPMKIKLQMLAMKYQIPWFVVKWIYNHTSLRKRVGTPIDKLACSCFDDLYPRVHKSKVNGGTGIGTLPPGGFKHLLHIFHWTRTIEGKYLGETRSLLKPTNSMGSFYIPSATELQLSAIVFKKQAGIHVSYNDKRLSGVMQITPLHIFNYSIGIYNDLLSFERGYMACGFPVTAYIACIVNLLQTDGDVQLLRAKGIVPSTGNDEKAVLRFVQQFKPELRDDIRMPNDLNILSETVKAHHERRSNRYYGEFKTRYCPNPWIIISVVAGILLFVLTFIQTIYSALSYYKQ